MTLDSMTPGVPSNPGIPGAVDTVLLDRDGTVIVDKHYLSDPTGVELLPGAAEGLQNLFLSGKGLFIVTNQSGIGRGYFSEADYLACHAALEDILHSAGVSLAGSAFCPHTPEEACACRKPGPGMWRTLATRYGLDASRTAMVGDKAEDILFGRNAGFPAVALVLTGKGAGVAGKLGLTLPETGEPFREVAAASLPGGEHLPHAVARTLEGAAAWILEKYNRPEPG